jgi:hypothetical protein
MSNGNFDVNEFVKESKDVLVNPNYFSTMKTSGGMTEPLIKAVIYGAIAGLLSFIWSFLRIGGATTSLFGSTVGFAVFIWAIVGAVIGLFIGAVILLVISSICKGSTDFEANVRVTAAVMIILPITAFVGFLTGMNIYLGAVVKLAIDIFALWLLYKGLTQSLKAQPQAAKIVMYVLVAVFVLFMFVGLGARRSVEQFMKGYNFEKIEESPKE